MHTQDIKTLATPDQCNFDLFSRNIMKPGKCRTILIEHQPSLNISWMFSRSDHINTHYA